MASNDKETSPRLVRDILLKLRNHFTTGLFIMAPTMVTIWVFIQGFRIFDGILGRLYNRYIFRPYGISPIPGLGAISLALLIILIGMLARLYAGRKLFDLWDKTVNRVPLINRVYIAVRQLSDAFAKGGGIIFQNPVLLEYPRKGLYSIGFVTRRCDSSFCRLVNHQIISVFIPTTPNPTSGVLIFVPQEDLIPLDMTVEDAMKLVISGGTVTPDIKLPALKAKP